MCFVKYKAVDTAITLAESVGRKTTERLFNVAVPSAKIPARKFCRGKFMLEIMRTRDDGCKRKFVLFASRRVRKKKKSDRRCVSNKTAPPNELSDGVVAFSL